MVYNMIKLYLFSLFCFSEEELSCSLHQGRLLEFYDKNMKEAVCAMCIITERCKQHEIVPISEMVGIKKFIHSRCFLFIIHHFI